MADATTPSPARSVSALARTLVAAIRSWAPAPPDHPAIAVSLDGGGVIADACAVLVETWERNARGDYTWAVVVAVDPGVSGIGPLRCM